MNFVLLLTVFASTSASACPNLSGYFTCNKSDLWKTQYLKIEQTENGYLFQDKITVFDEDFNDMDVVRNYKHILGESTSVVDTGRFTVLVKDNVSCDASSLIVASERIVTRTNETYSFHTAYRLNEKGNLVYEGLEKFTCKRQ